MTGKQILAFAALGLIALLYIAVLILAFVGSPHTQELLMASLFCTIIIPIFIYAWQLLFRLKKDEKKDKKK